MQPRDLAGTCSWLDFKNDADVKSDEGQKLLSVDSQCALYTSERKDFTAAKAKQLEEFAKFNVYEEVNFQDQEYCTSRWVLSTKEDGTLKARLVVRGFEDPDYENLVTDSPTCSRDSFRLILMISTSMELWENGSRVAFLQ